MTMSDLKGLLEPLNTSEMPDRWDAIRRRHVEPMPEPHRSRVGAYVTAGSVALLAVGVVAWLSPLGSEPTPRTPGGEVQPPAWLVQQAYEMAYGNGDLIPDSASWVLSDANTIAPAVGLQSGDPALQEYLVVMHGDFTAYGAKVAAGRGSPTGSILTFAAQADTHDVTDWGVGDQSVDVVGLTPFTLPPPTDMFTADQGWSVAVPPGWHTQAVTLSRSEVPVDGAMFSNVNLPGPTGGEGTFPQASAIDFPSGGIALVVSSFSGEVMPGDTQPIAPPLSIEDFAKGSAEGSTSTLDSLVFQGPEGLFVATIRTGSDASAVDLAAIDAAVGSLAFDSTSGTPHAPASEAAAAGLPTNDSVVDGRFVVPVELDGGTLRIDPPAEGSTPTVPRADVEDEIWGSPTFQGKTDAVLGYGLVTMQLSQHGVDAVESVPGWIAIGWGGTIWCPDMTAAPSPVDLPSDGYVAVAIGSFADVQPFEYAAETSICGQAPIGPNVQPATHVVSIDWDLVGTTQGTSADIIYVPAPCGTGKRLIIDGDPSGSTLAVEMTIPDAPLPCPSPSSITGSVDLSGEGSVRHAPLGIVRQFNS
jgi:hypothetical protein